MAKVVLGMTMSLDGYINDSNGSIDILYEDLFNGVSSEILEVAQKTTGAVIMSKSAYLLSPDVDQYADNYEFQVPIFVLTHHIPLKHPKENDNLKFIFVTEGLEKAIELAKQTVKDNKDIVIICGAKTANDAIKSKLIDEIQIDIMPLILGKGLKLFNEEINEIIKLEKIELTETKERVSIKYRIIK